MAKKSAPKKKKSVAKSKTKCDEVCSKDDCGGGICPIKKPKKKTTAKKAQAVEPVAPKVSLCSKVMAALFFWKK